MADERPEPLADPRIEAVLAKLEPGDRDVLRAALARAGRSNEELRYLADHDALTGLFGRRRFLDELDQYVEFTARYGGRGAVLVVDIDGLKGVNDSFGHRAGDGLIVSVATILRGRVRTTDIVARLAGDEFAVLMPQTDSAGAMRLGEDLRAQVATDASVAPAGVRATVSVGITMFGGEPGLSSGAVLEAADQAMYEAKESGRNQLVLFRDPAQARRSARSPRTTAARIRDALAEDRLTLHSQPIRDLASGEVERYELLLRMVGESGQLLPAANFIEVAERSGMVRELDRWVIGRAFDLLAERERRGSPVSLHVNLSGASFGDAAALELIERCLDESGTDPRHLTFEITEAADVYDLDAAAGFADSLTEFGCQVAIDDYGSGFSPFHYLRRIPFDLIKIDGSFVAGMAASDADQLVVKAIVEIAQGLGKATIAEYVQDDRTTELLREYGVDMAQGFHLGRPTGIGESFGDDDGG